MADVLLQDAFNAVASELDGKQDALNAQQLSVINAQAFNESGFYTKAAVDSKVDMLAGMIASVNTAEFAGPFASVDAIPAPYDSNDMYLVGAAEPYAMYALVGGALKKIGTLDVDLSQINEALNAHEVALADQQAQITSWADMVNGVNERVNDVVNYVHHADGIMVDWR